MGRMRTRVGSSSKRRPTSAAGSPQRTRMPRSSVSYSRTVPTMRRSEVAEPPTATAWAGSSTSTPSKMSSMRSRVRRISAAEGGSEESSSSARLPEPTGQERTLLTPSETVPRITSVEPPPMSTTPISPSAGCPRPLVAPMKESRPSSSSGSTSIGTPAAAATASATSSQLRASRTAAVATARISSAPSSRASRTWVPTTSPTSSIFSGRIRPLPSTALPIRV